MLVNRLLRSRRFVFWSCCAVALIALLVVSTGAWPEPLHGQTEVSSPDGLSQSVREKLEQRGTIMLRDATLVEAMFIVEQQWGVNIVISNDAKEAVNGSYKDAPLHEILDTLLSSQGYGYRVVGDSLVVMQLDELGTKRPLFETMRIPLQHVPPDEIVELIKILLSPDGAAHAVPSARSIVVMDFPERIEVVRERIRELDEAAAEAEQQDELERQRAAQAEMLNAARQRAMIRSNESSTGSTSNVSPEAGVGAPRATLPENIAQQPDETYGLADSGLEAEAPAVPDLELEIFTPQYVEAAAIVESLATMVSEYGQVTAIDEENRIVAIDQPAYLQRMHYALKRLDVARPQVRISAIIFDASLEDLENVGLNLTHTARGNNLNASGVAQDSLTIGTMLAPTPGVNALNGGITAMSLSRNFDITGVVNMLRNSNRSKLLADPTVVVMHRESARIEIVTEIPYQQLTESAQGGTIGTTAFREAGVTLQVSPHICGDGTVRFVVTPQFSVLTGFTEEENQPIIARRNAQTVVTVADQQTLVIGGLRQRSRVRNRASVPYLADMKFIGPLFRQRDDEIRESELLVFLTPTIITPQHFGTRREQCVLENGKCELEKISSDTCYRCGPPEDPTIYSNHDFSYGSVHVNVGPAAEMETIEAGRSASPHAVEVNPTRLPAARPREAVDTPVQQQLPQQLAPPPLNVPQPNTSMRRNRPQDDVRHASEAAPVRPALRVQQAQRAPVQPARTQPVGSSQARHHLTPAARVARNDAPSLRYTKLPPIETIDRGSSKANDAHRAPGGLARPARKLNVIKQDAEANDVPPPARASGQQRALNGSLGGFFAL